jgi:hypothetical protein
MCRPGHVVLDPRPQAFADLAPAAQVVNQPRIVRRLAPEARWRNARVLDMFGYSQEKGHSSNRLY